MDRQIGRLGCRRPVLSGRKRKGRIFAQKRHRRVDHWEKRAAPWWRSPGWWNKQSTRLVEGKKRCGWYIPDLNPCSLSERLLVGGQGYLIDYRGRPWWYGKRYELNPRVASGHIVVELNVDGCIHSCDQLLSHAGEWSNRAKRTYKNANNGESGAVLVDHNRIRQDRDFRGRAERGPSLETAFSLSLQSLYHWKPSGLREGSGSFGQFWAALVFGDERQRRICDFTAKILLRVGCSRPRETIV